MNNKEFAARMREEAEKWENIVPVSMEQWLRIADRIEASPDPAGAAPFRGLGDEG